MLIFTLYCCEAATGFVATSGSSVEDNLNSGNPTDICCVTQVDT